MLKSRYLKIHVTNVEQNQYLIMVKRNDDHILPPDEWKYLFFNRHDESYFGTMLETKIVNGLEGVLIDGWQLVTLFGKERFNRLIDWDWDETSQICLASAHTVLDSMHRHEWVPDFASWENNEFQWTLPERVMNEFNADFWEENLQTNSGSITNKQFVQEWFNHSVESYMNQDEEMKNRFGDKLASLKKQELPSKTLASFFDEDSWLEWIGLKENSTPFTLGIKLEEPPDIDQPWSLELFLRDKNKPDRLIDHQDTASFPSKWRSFEHKIDLEQEKWIQLFPWLKGKKGIANQLTEEEAWIFLTEASETLLALGVDILLPSWWQAMKSASLKMKARVKSSNSHRRSFVGLQAMLEYDWRFSMNGVDLSEEEFKKMVEEKRRLIQIRGRWIKLDPAFIHQIQQLMIKAEKEGLHVRDIIEQELIAAENDESDAIENPRAFAKIQIELNRQWKQMIHKLKKVNELPLETVSTSFQGELRPYQQLGMSWLLFLRNYRFGACLADDMGLGKTIQLISYLLKVKEQENAGPALIICPTSVLGNWQKEVERFAPNLTVYLHYGANRLKEDAFAEQVANSDIVLTSYGLTHLDLEDMEKITWSTVAIDEAQNIKNAHTKQSRAVRKLKGLHHIALTGTPMENRLTELWSIFDFTNHGYLGSLGQFQRRFVLPIEKEDEKEQIQKLQTLIRPFLLRRTKKDEDVSLNLPDKLEQKEYCPLTAEQASLYEQVVRDTFDSIEKLTTFERKGLVLQMLSRLKQLCNHPSLYLKEEKPTHLLTRSTKLEKLNELLKAVLEQKESCLIFTQYIEMGQMIQKMAKDQFNIQVPFLNGSVPKQERDRMIHRFQNQEFPIFLLSLKAGGTGLNLTAANHVIHYDRWWNPAVENQATDRAYRIGQKRFVHVHKLICTGTLEEKIDAMLEKKQSLNDQIIQSENWITKLSTDELRDLVHLF
ncbi:DEAD/DEAH box helicase [Bacillus sp. 03113]|uniref:DEAD/DEAH box helicase n=1 Tax=Bacillus sp. 03113 TaxID=2578211 RepID=UPI0011420B3A|nr:DEAD/DEAH box helicase [Bacillus sp. 03113]